MASPECQAVVNYSFQIVKQNGTVGKSRSVQLARFHDGYSSWGCSIPMEDGALKELIWEDGSINFKVKMNFLIFMPPETQTQIDLQTEIKSFENRELQKLSESMTQIIGGDSRPELGKIIKIFSKDGVEFYANTLSLAERSLVFKVMLSSAIWKEGQGSGGANSLVLEDLSGKTVKVFLHYLMGGVLLEDDWKAEDVILELTYAAQKYQLDGLTEFLDKVLPLISFNDTEILAKLGMLTKRLGLKNAEKELLEKLKEEAVDIEDLLLNKEGSLLEKD